MADNQGLVIKAERGRDRFRAAGGIPVGEHNDQSLVDRISIGTEGAVLFCRFVKAKQSFAFEAKAFRKIRCRGKVSGRTGAQIENQRIDLFPELCELFVHGLQIRGRKRSETQIANMVLEQFAIKRCGRFGRRACFLGQDH